MIRPAVVVWLALIGPPAVRAQRPGPAVGLGATVVASDPVYGGVGATVVAPFDRQVRLTAGGTLGRSGRRTVGRGELALEYLLDPVARRWSPRLAGGVAGVSGPRGGGFLLLMIGLEQRPRGPTGWRIDLGIGGGLRLAASFTWRLGRR